MSAASERGGNPLRAVCANCAAALQGRWCHQCGQRGDDHHRSIRHLASEAIEGFFHVDSRIWRTLRGLALHPGRLTREYVQGRRVSQLPPLRLFLVSLLLLFMSGAVPRSAGDFEVTIESAKVEDPATAVRVEVLGQRDTAAEAWLREHLARAVGHPEEFKLILENWCERFAILMLPITAGLLWLLFAFDRRFRLFDHVIFAMHSLAFIALLATLGVVAGRLLPVPAGWLMVFAPLHLFFHLRSFYGLGLAGTSLRTGLLLLAGGFSFLLLSMGLVWVGLASLGPS